MTGERDDASITPIGGAPISGTPIGGDMSGQELVALRSAGLPRVRFKAAPSLAQASIGDIILIDDRGEVLGPGRLRSLRWLGLLKLGILTSAVAVVPGALVGSALFGGVAAVGYLGVCAWLSRPINAIRRGVALVAAREYQAAEAVFADLERRHLPPRYQRIIDVYMAKVAWRRGKLDQAHERYERAIKAYDRLKPGESGMYWLCAFDRTQLACVRGDLEHALTLRAALADAPDGEYFQLERLFTDLLIGFHRGSSAAIQDDLYDAAKLAFQSNCFGRALVLLSWAFYDRGDDEMAELALREAPARLEREALAESIPRLHAWMVERHSALQPEEWPLCD